MTKPSKYPECERLSEAAPRSQLIGEFLEWLDEQGIVLAAYGKNRTWPDPILDSRESILARFFGIDLKKVEKERMDILKSLQT